MARIYLTIFFSIQWFSVFSQSQFNYFFYKNLVNQKETDLAILYLNNSLVKNTNQLQLDSIYFYKGLLFFEKKQFDSTISSLNKLETNLPFSSQAAFIKAIAISYVNHLDSSLNDIINAIESNDSTVIQMKSILLASIYLINKNYKAYDSTIKQVKDSLYIYNSLQNTLNKWSAQRNKKIKSGLLSAGLSAIVPGLGKVYAGKGFDGLSTFLIHVPLAFIVNESYRFAGVNSARFITFSSIASLFYFGNILTSYYYIKNARKEEDIDRKNEILLQCNVMLRNYYN